MKKYLDMLADSLECKERILRKLLEKCEIQKEQVSKDEVNWEEFDATVEEKDGLIEELLKQDEGFQGLYDRIKDELPSQKDSYKEEIRKLQGAIKTVTELSMELETREQRNKIAIEKRFRESRDKIKQARVGSNVAANYYKKMNKINTVDPQLMDKKS